MKSSFHLPRHVFTFAAAFALCSFAPAATIIWSGGGGANMQWFTNLNWTGGLVPGAGDSAFFSATAATNVSGAANVNNIVDGNLTVSNLTYAPLNAYDNTVINPGVMLTISNASAVPNNLLVTGTESDAGATAFAFATVSGAGGTLSLIGGTNSLLNVRQDSGTAGSHLATLDLSGLDTFNASIGMVLVAVQAPPGAPSIARPAGTLILAKTNVITVSGTAAGLPGEIEVADGASNGGSADMQLGQTNSIFADTIIVGGKKTQAATLRFNPNLTAPALYLRGVSVNRVSNITIADQSGLGTASTTTCVGNMNLSGGSVDAMVDTITIGKGQANTGTGSATGTLTLGGGTLDVNTLYAGYENFATAGSDVTGTLTVNAGGKLVVNTTLVLGRYTGGAATRARGTLNINGGMVAAQVIQDTGGTSTLNLTGGSLIVTNTAGTAGNPIGAFTVDSSTVQSTLRVTIPSISSVPINVKNLTADGNASDTNLINIASLPSIVSFPTIITLIQSANAMTLTGGSFNFGLGTLPAGYTASIVESGDGKAVQLVVTAGPVVVNVWTGADIAGHSITNWSDGLNWASGVAPGPSSTVFFNAAASQSASALSTPGGGSGALILSKINNIVDTNLTVGGVFFTNVNGTYENTLITNNRTLSIISSGLSVGSSTLDFGDTTGNVTISGAGGALNVSNSTASIYVGLGDNSGGTTPEATLDLSALGTFNATVGNFLLGVGGYPSVFTVAQPAGIVYLAKTNIISVSSATADSSDSSPVALEVGDADTLAGSISSALYLGLTNAIFADNISVGRQLASGGIFFNPAVTNDGPSAYFRGASANTVGTWTIGDGVVNSLTVAASGTDDFSGGSVDAMVNTMYVAKSSSASATVSAVTGTLTFGAGTIAANTINVSYNNAYSDGTVYNYGVGAVNVNGTGSLVVNNTLNMAFTGGSLAGGAAPTATLNVNGASASAAANSIMAGVNGAISTINVQGGTLTITNTAGSSAAPLSSLNLTNSTLSLGFANAQTAPTGITVSNLNVGGSSTTVNVLSLPPLPSYPTTFKAIQSVNPISGTFNFVLGNLPAGGYTATITESADHTAVLLNVTSGPIGVQATFYWSGADAPNTNWSDRLNWQLPGNPGAATNNIVFNDAAAQVNSSLSTPGGGGGAIIPGSFDNIVDANYTISSLTFSNLGTYHNTFINNGETLAVIGNSVNVGTLDNGANNELCNVTVAGNNGTLNINNTTATVNIWNGGSGGGSRSTVDMSALGNFSATVSRLLIGGNINSTVDKSSGILYLARTNTITAEFQVTQASLQSSVGGNAAIVVADANANPGLQSFLYLGQVNSFTLDTIGIGRQRANGTLQFNPIYANTAPFPTVTFQGFSSGLVSFFEVGDGTSQSGTASLTADANLAGGLVTAAVDTMNIARASSSGSGTIVGSLEFDGGTITANTLNIGLQPTAGRFGVGTMSVSSNSVIGSAATLVVNGSLNLGLNLAGGGTSTSGTLNVTNAIVRANTITAGPNSTISVYGGSLAVTNTAGSAAAPIATLSFSNSTFQVAAAATPSVTVSTLDLDGQTTTTNVIRISSVPHVTPPVEFPLIKYATLTLLNGSVTNVGLGALPAGYAGYLTNDAANGVIGLVITTVPALKPAIFTAAGVQAGTNFVISGTNGLAGGVYVVLTSTNVALPLANWVAVATNSFNGSGAFNATVPYSASDRSRFYVIQSR